MAKNDAKDRFLRLRKVSTFSPVWGIHAEKDRALPFGFDKVSIERIVRTGSVTMPEVNISGDETVHVSGTIEAERVQVVIALKCDDSLDFALIVTIKRKDKRG